MRCQRAVEKLRELADKCERANSFERYREIIARGSLRGGMALAGARVSLSQLV